PGLLTCCLHFSGLILVCLRDTARESPDGGFLQADFGLDIKWTSILDIRTEKVNKARIREIDKALIKYKGLGYEVVVREVPPSFEDGEIWGLELPAQAIQPSRALQGSLTDLHNAYAASANAPLGVTPDYVESNNLLKEFLEGHIALVLTLRND
ncbi:hypothetical protein KC342_g19040, partial [Hortaea werneckii]